MLFCLQFFYNGNSILWIYNQLGYSKICSVCKGRIHKQCIPNISDRDYIHIREDDNWICIMCLELILPFYHIVDDTEFTECFSGLLQMHQNILKWKVLIRTLTTSCAQLKMEIMKVISLSFLLILCGFAESLAINPWLMQCEKETIRDDELQIMVLGLHDL